MSVATEFAPSVPLLDAIPARVRPHVPATRPAELATVTVLRAPGERSLAAPLRLTRRGVVALALAVVALGVTLVWVAALSAPSSVAAPAGGPSVVTVQAGDTLWSIASRVAPQRDPRAEVAVLQRRNHLSGADLTPGQQLRVH